MTHHEIVTSPSIPSPFITVTPYPLLRSSFANFLLSLSFGEKIRTTTSPIAIDDSMYDPTIVPAANPKA